ncbi:MAG: ATP synthase F0 subunit B [Spirochaetaceae bacterium]|jgi:F-type H+-transporting ATPase subunit b|nr:ATP synthase F0 subunit B [Spirochaetaceae bacterium]
MLDFSVTFVITLINLGILFLILRSILFKPVSRFIEERAKRVQDDRDEARRSRAEAEAALKQIEGRLKNAEEEAAELIRAAQDEARQDAAAIVAGGKAEAERFLAQARLQAQAEYQTALRLFQAEAAALVVSAAGKLAGRGSGSEAERLEQAAALIRGIGSFPAGERRV